MEAVFLGFVLMLSIFLGFELISKVPATPPPAAIWLPMIPEREPTAIRKVRP